MPGGRSRPRPWQTRRWMMTVKPSMLAPGSVIGVLGGGQLGRFLAMAAADLGFACHVYCPEPDSPAFALADQHMIAPYEDEAALTRFAEQVDVVTYEFENVPAATVEVLEALVPVLPGRRALETAQDRLAEKRFFSDLGIEVAPFAEVNDAADLERALGEIGAPAILKTRRFGYDGKGQARIGHRDEAGPALESLRGAPAILEQVIDFDFEISVIAARCRSGDFAAYAPGRNIHRNHILDQTFVPADIPAELERRAVEICRTITEALDYAGVIGVEFFVCDGGARLLVNEIAPRVHNSGHWTLDGAPASQFEQHIRAVAGWPLRDPRRHSDAVMTNLIGEDVESWGKWAAEPLTAVHLYGKPEVRAGRKMGHVTRLTPMTPDAGD